MQSQASDGSVSSQAPEAGVSLSWIQPVSEGETFDNYECVTTLCGSANEGNRGKNVNE